MPFVDVVEDVVFNYIGWVSLGYFYLSHALAISKHTAAKSCGAGRNKNGREFLAAVESSFVYGFQSFGKFKRDEIDTGRECIVADGLYASGNLECLNSFASAE